MGYEEIARLTQGHDRGITKVAFSPAGNFIATAGLDGKVCVWDSGSKGLLYSFDGTSPVLSLIWLAPSEKTILCGLQDGNMVILKIDSHRVSVTGFWAHAYPVECLAARTQDNRLASGAHQELLIWEWDGERKYRLDREISELPKKARNQSDDVLVTSIHWTSSTQYPALLLVTYMYHGVLLMDAMNWTRLRTISLHSPIASASLSEDGLRLAISNTVRGFDVYSMQSGGQLCALDQAGDRSPTPVRFIHGSLALLGGSTTGELKVWDIMDTTTGGPALNTPFANERQPSVICTLQVPRRSKVLAIDAYYNEERDEFFIAAGLMDEWAGCSCILWKALDQDLEGVAAPPDDDGVAESAAGCTLRVSAMTSAIVVALAVTLAYTSLVIDYRDFAFRSLLKD